MTGEMEIGFWCKADIHYRHFDGKKYFSALLDEVRQIGQKQGDCCGLKLEVRNDNTDAKEVYKKYGFQDFEHEVWIMRLSLKK
jgi:ribosomal protein S18 acetylase RimI-like enzyme